MTATMQALIKEIEDEPIFRQRLTELLMTPPAPARQNSAITYEEFLAWADEDTLAEWVNGEIIMSSPASYWHQNVVDFLVTILRVYVETRQLGIICSAPFQMKLKPAGREPDLIFLAKPHLDRLKKTYLDGPADLVIEIVSPESVARDRGEKFYEYEAGGISEYWLIDPIRTWAEFYHLNQEGRYTTAFAGKEGVYQVLMIPGFWVRVEWFWQDPLPHTLQALAEIIGLTPEVLEPFLSALGGGTDRSNHETRPE